MDTGIASADQQKGPESLADSAQRTTGAAYSAQTPETASESPNLAGRLNPASILPQATFCATGEIKMGFGRIEESCRRQQRAIGPRRIR
jgi:hypothetical protein